VTTLTAGKTEYKRRVAFMVDRQKGICCICHDPYNRMSYEIASFEHGDLRGMGGGRRNDSVDAVNEKGEYVNGAAHGFCNGMKGSKR
jgi:hypothetical protein